MVIRVERSGAYSATPLPVQAGLLSYTVAGTSWPTSSVAATSRQPLRAIGKPSPIMMISDVMIKTLSSLSLNEWIHLWIAKAC